MKNSYSLAVVCAGILFGVSAMPGSLAAQADGQADGPAGVQAVAMQPVSVTASLAESVAPSAAAPDGIPASPVGPVVDAIAFHNAATESKATRVVADQEVGPHVNRGLALTIAGIAAMGVAYAVKGEAGTVIALGGAALALYGVYHWIQ